MKTTFKTAELPTTVFMVFNNDCAYYQGRLTEIKNINEEEDSCVLCIEIEGMNQVKCKVNYSKLNSDVIDYDETGIHLFMTNEDVNQWFRDHPEILAAYDD